MTTKTILSACVRQAGAILIAGLFATVSASAQQADPAQTVPPQQGDPDTPATPDQTPPGSSAPADAEPATPLAGPDDWTAYGRDIAGSRFAPFEQITPDNIGNLEVAWTFRTGGAGPNQATPLQIGDTLYFCTRDNIVVALDAENGEERWRHDPQIDTTSVGGCRGVSFHQQSLAAEQCEARIITTTRDARLIALDARTGEPCGDFGEQGTVDLRKGMGDDELRYQYNTSPPTVVGDVAVVGAAIYDGQAVEEPSGVVRGYDVVTGAFRWAWDMGRPDDNTEPAEGEFYTRGTPNVWSIGSADPELGLVYLPLGNATPDYFGAHRTPEMEEFASSIVALDVTDGSVRWHFQTAHHDIWDYDVASQPVLVDFPTESGPVPAVIQPTKRGEIFVFDRRTGEPLTEIEERPTPQGAVEGDFTAPTQPFSVGMPSVAGEPLTEADMWGLTPIDQLVCRIMFKRARYEGPMTPPSLEGTVFYPGYAGGSNWGSVSIDEDRGIMMVYSQHVANLTRLIPTDSPEAAKYDERGETGRAVISPATGSAQDGTPYAVANPPFLSFLNVPCQRPPYGKMTAIDLESRSVLWSKPLGTTRKSGPWGTAIGIPFEMGVPLNGGSLVTRSGLTFYAGSQDGYIRAYNTETGDEVWRRDMPVGAQATPMSYVSPESGDQFVVVTAGGGAGLTERGDYVIAYKLTD